MSGRPQLDAADPQGFEPSEVKLKASVAARLTFVRTTDKTCATEIVFPSLKIKRALPLNQSVVLFRQRSSINVEDLDAMRG